MQTDMAIPPSHKYYNFKQKINDLPKLLTEEELEKIETDPNKDYYVSIFRYNEKHKNLYANKKDKKGRPKPSVKGPEFWDVVTDTLVWDFDNPNPEVARQDVIELARRLNEKYNIGGEEMYVSYSGNKGFHLSLKINRDITQEQFKNITTSLVDGLVSYDPSVCDPPRVLRMEHTKNLGSGLYKIPLTIDEVLEKDMPSIKELAKNPREDFPETSQARIQLPDELFQVKEVPIKNNNITELDEEVDLNKPPKGWKPYKWSLVQGFFDGGERHNALMVIAATCRSLGYDKNTTYYICKSALKNQTRRTGDDEFDKGELWQNIIEDSIFSDGWEGGSYNLKNPWLKRYCEKMGFNTEEEDELPFTPLEDLDRQFLDFSENFEQNIIKTGINDIDENLMLCIGTLNGLLGQPGSGKTTVALEILKNSSLNNIPSMFFSLDMGPQLVYAKLVQKETGLGFKQAMEMYRENSKRRQEIFKVITEKYGNIGFNFKCGSTVADLKNYIISHRELTGQSLKFIVVDYLELVSGPYADVNANAAIIVHSLKNLATEEGVCILLLLQTQKHSTPDIADPLTSMKQIKGASAIEQDCSTVLTLWREGYNPDHVDDDKYISFALVKNRFDSLWKGDFHWEPIKGNVRSLTEEEEMELEEFKKRKKQEKQAASRSVGTGGFE